MKPFADNYLECFIFLSKETFVVVKSSEAGLHSLWFRLRAYAKGGFVCVRRLGKSRITEACTTVGPSRIITAVPLD